jgi:hypothetical protein
MNADFLKRTGIPKDFNPFKQALWTAKDDSLEKLKEEVDSSIYSARSKYRFPVTLKYCKNTQTN